MLISPLMSPILGVGLALAIHDKKVLIRSLRNLSIAVLISLAASVLYFFISPLGEPTSELQARTFPTLLDVLVALFGGIAGIVSISRHDQTTAIPGVAIATALMPPLCTAGFGIATANWNYFFGAFYLFFINAVFISLATYLIVRYLQFPEKEFINTRVAKQYRRWFVILSMVALTPSVYFLYTVYEKELIKEEINDLVLTPVKKQGNEILKWELLDKDSTKFIKVYHSGRQLSDSLKKAIDSTLTDHRINYRLLSLRVNLTKEEVNELSAEMTKQMLRDMHLEEVLQKDTVNLSGPDPVSNDQLTIEAKMAFPAVDSISAGWLALQNAHNMSDSFRVVFYRVNKPFYRSEVNRFYKYLLARLARDTVILIRR